MVVVLRNFLLIFIKAYQVVLSPMWGPACRFYPTCSAYAYTAVRRYGAVKGGYLAVKRLLKCHPFHRGGYDPVP